MASGEIIVPLLAGKAERYEILARQLEAPTAGGPDLVSNLSNIAAVKASLEIRRILVPCKPGDHAGN